MIKRYLNPLQVLRYKIIMDEETFETAKENDLSLDEAEQLQELIDDTGLDPDEAIELLD